MRELVKDYGDVKEKVDVTCFTTSLLSLSLKFSLINN